MHLTPIKAESLCHAIYLCVSGLALKHLADCLLIDLGAPGRLSLAPPTSLALPVKKVLTV